MCDGSSVTKGNPKPVTLVKTVVTRKTSAQRPRSFPLANPPATTRPARMPIRLSTTWISVNVVRLKIMVVSLREGRGSWWTELTYALPSVPANGP